MSKASFRHQDIAAAPKGWKVRTVDEGRHRIRIAFPPGRRRKKGDGKLISILHPLRENPCPMRRNSFSTAREKAAFVAGLTDGSKRLGKALESLRARRATRLERMTGRGLGRTNPKPLAAATHEYWPGPRTYELWQRGPGKSKELVAVTWSKREGKEMVQTHNAHAPQGIKFKLITRKNPDGAGLGQAQSLYRRFHGRDSRELLELQDDAEGRSDFASLGELVEVVVMTPGQEEKQDVSKQTSALRDRGATWTAIGEKLGISLIEIPFKNTFFASDPTGSQLYFIGDGQRLNDAEIEKLGKLDIDVSKDVLELGELLAVTYRARKFQTKFEESDWEHILGEENESRPVLAYDKPRGRFVAVGGNYRIERPGIIN